MLCRDDHGQIQSSIQYPITDMMEPPGTLYEYSICDMGDETVWNAFKLLADISTKKRNAQKQCKLNSVFIHTALMEARICEVSFLNAEYKLL